MAEAEVSNTIYVWASFLLPAAVLMFVYAWDQLLLFCTSLDKRRPPSQRALLRKTARYKPINYSTPSWICRKHLVRHRIAGLQWRKGGYGYAYYYAPQHTSYAISFWSSYAFDFFAVKWLSIIEMWFWWIHFKLFKSKQLTLVIELPRPINPHHAL